MHMILAQIALRSVQLPLLMELGQEFHIFGP